MAALDTLPPDQRAVLQLVLQRGRSYDEIAQLLSIDRAAVRQRALAAFDGLTPATVLLGPEHALVTDYLLEQLPEKVAEQVYSFLQASDADREWAEAILGVIAPLVSRSLPEIPVGAPLGADEWSGGGLEHHSDPSAPAAESWMRTAEEPEDLPAVDGPAPATDGMLPPVRTETGPKAEPAGGSWGQRQETRPSSRRGGAILLSAVAVMIAAAIVIAVAGSGTGPKKHHGSTGPSSTVTEASSTLPTSSSPTSSTPTTTTPATATTTQILAQLNLRSPTGAASTVGIVEVVRVKGVLGIVIDAQGVPANTTHNAYAVWLYNSPASEKRVGFVTNLVGKSGQLVTDGRLPAGAAAYHRILITLETQPNPTHPGEVVLSGPFRERP
jgi:hypothetical protein